MRTFTSDDVSSFLLILEEAGERAHAMDMVLLANGIDSVVVKTERGLLIKPRLVRGAPEELFTLDADTIAAFSVGIEGGYASVNTVDGRRLMLELCKAVRLPYTEMDDGDIEPGEVYCRRKDGDESEGKEKKGEDADA